MWNIESVTLMFCVYMVLVNCTTATNITAFDGSRRQIELWVSNVTGFSSQYNTEAWSANQVIGPFDVYPKYGDIPGTWAPRATRNQEYLELEFMEEMYIETISVYETYNSGAISMIKVWNSQTQSYHSVYQGTPAHLAHSRIFTPQISTVAFKSKRIRLDIDCRISQSWCEIDAVKISGNLSYHDSIASSKPLSIDMKTLLYNGTYFDVSFMVEGVNISAHRAILASRSAYFNHLFSKASTENEIVVSGIKQSTFMSILEFIYTGKINCNLTAPTIQGIFQLANEHDLGELQQLFNYCLFNETSEEIALANIGHLGLQGCVTLCKDVDDLLIHRTPPFNLKGCICKCIE